MSGNVLEVTSDTIGEEDENVDKSYLARGGCYYYRGPEAFTTSYLSSASDNWNAEYGYRFVVDEIAISGKYPETSFCLPTRVVNDKDATVNRASDRWFPALAEPALPRTACDRRHRCRAAQVLTVRTCAGQFASHPAS
jgi:hypothetical protein